MTVTAVVSGSDTPLVENIRHLRLSQLLQSPPLPTVRPAQVNPADPAVMVQSSGTTGTPQIFVRTHVELQIWTERYASAQGWSRDERCLCLTAMSFNVGRNICLGMLQLGATVIVNSCTTSGDVVETARDKRISYLKLAPPQLVSLLEYAVGRPMLFPGLRSMVVGSAPTSHEQRLLTRKLLTPNLCEQLGSNEAGLIAFAFPGDQDAFPGAVGKIVNGVEAEVVDDKGACLLFGQIRLRAAGYPQKYFDDPAATARKFRDGWFYPGDLASLNAEGYLFLKGRADDVINNGGSKFYPVEVENAIAAHPLITEVAVFPWPNAQSGSSPAAAIVLNRPLPNRQLISFYAEHLAPWMIPIHTLQLAELPRNAMGKVVKGKLAQHLKQALRHTK